MILRGKLSIAAKVGTNQLRQFAAFGRIGSDNDGPIRLLRVIERNRREAMVRVLVLVDPALLLKLFGCRTRLMLTEG
jgi:hypothetical protein